MKAPILFSAALLLLTLSCKKTADPDAEMPSIKSISFQNLPTKDVQFNPENGSITIQLPAVLPEEGLVPVVELSKNTEIIGGVTSTGALDLSALCGCPGYEQLKPGISLTLANDVYMRTYRTLRSYWVAILPAKGSFKPIAEFPITYTTSGSSLGFIEISLPLKNLYQNPQVYEIWLKDKATSKVYGYKIPGGFCANSCKADRPNRMTVNYDKNIGGGELPVGSYEVSIGLLSRDSGLITFPQSLVIKE